MPQQNYQHLPKSLRLQLHFECMETTYSEHVTCEGPEQLLTFAEIALPSRLYTLFEYMKTT